MLVGRWSVFVEGEKELRVENMPANYVLISRYHSFAPQARRPCDELNREYAFMAGSYGQPGWLARALNMALGPAQLDLTVSRGSPRESRPWPCDEIETQRLWPLDA